MKLSAIVAFSCIVLTILFSFLLALKVDWINGPEYWKWDYRGTGFLLEDHPLFLLSFLAFIPHLLAQYFYNKQQKKIRLALFLCSLSFFLQILVQSGIQENPFSLNRVTNVIESPIMTGYYTVSLKLTDASEFIKSYSTIMAGLGHSHNKPPGSILYYYFIRKILIYFGTQNDLIPMLAGIILGLFSTLIAPTTYYMIRTISNNRSAAFYGASFISIYPALILFFPGFDQAYPTIFNLMIILWCLSLIKQNSLCSAMYGFLLAISLFMVFTFAVTGVFIASYTVYFVVKNSNYGFRTVLLNSFLAALAFLLFYFLLFVFLDYNILRVVKDAMATQEIVEPKNRIYPYTIPYDIYDFILGAGWIPVIFIFYFIKNFRINEKNVIGLLCLAQIIVVALSGLLKTETARVWLFLTPMLAYPVGIILSKTDYFSRQIFFVCLLLITIQMNKYLLFFH